MTISTNTSFATGLRNLDHERVIDALPVSGELPDWLNGSLIRNGPAAFDCRGGSFRHWFDGQAMLHRFEIAEGRVGYRNRYVDTPSSRSVRSEGRIAYSEFATDPCQSLFSRFFTQFRRVTVPNPNVNVQFGGEHAVALTELPLAVEFDPRTLDTLRVSEYEDSLRGNLTTAHPHADPATGDLVNYLLRFGRTSAYQVYRQARGNRRELIGTVPADRPGYLHSFAITERHVVLMIFPLVVNPLSFLLRGKPFIANYRWRPELGTRIVVLDSRTGEIRTDTRTAPLFSFHHINAFEEDDSLVIDLSQYEDSAVVDALYLDRLRAGEPIPLPRPVRHRVELGSGRVRSTVLSEEPLELPTIDYRQRNGRPYRYAYGVGAADRTGADFFDQLVKLDTHTGRTIVWQEPGTYPGEPVFVPTPQAGTEDEGVALSVVLDPAADRSLLVVLDAHSFTELARAEVPHPIPFGFHGQFTRTR
ncbi:carotenoid oxygenase family protein [Amycolatopsis aidingensis]|uniref:carotenoid oxygenase family protein n=1 Tax=Amycolatopsis aidingensis TaxID=2842453 RepID=UPI001C0ADE44|nr:carotenoid oxygenase family protein [Amycolatopsis aidingensis]